MKIRPSDVLKYENCPRQFKFSRDYKPNATPGNLALGTAVHAAIEVFLKEEKNPLEGFRNAWDKQLASGPIDFCSKEESCFRTFGENLANGFSEFWKESGFSPARDAGGNVLMEVRLEAEIAPGVVLSGQPDLVAWNSEARLIVLDFKTACSRANPLFVNISEQLTAYQILLNAHAERLGLPEIDGLAFLEGLKRKTMTNVWGIHASPPRDKEEVKDYLCKVKRVAKAMQQSEFPRMPRMAWNSPCTLCEFAKGCIG